MPIAAVPEYVGSAFKTASPGMRFGMYLKLWGVNRRTNAFLWTTYDIDYEIRGQNRQEREVKCENKTSAINDACHLNRTDKALMEKLATRQRAIFATRAGQEAGLCIEAVATAPFATGLGNEHPLENGFAFLWPYGLAYLPGSGVKGVVRRAAQELAQGLWENDRGWKGLDQPAYWIETGSGKDRRRIELSVIDVLFGREPPSGDSDAVRGALSFWDVIPEIPGGHLMVEIMTPHQSHYYQEKKERKSGDSTTPHDSGQPNPIAFLTVPPGAKFCFCVVCDERHLRRLTQNKANGAPDLFAEGATHWKTLLTSAFEHAFDWLGFGAKTAVGYGAMATTKPCEQKETASAATVGSTVPEEEAVWEQATLEYKPNTQEVTASFQNQKTAPLRGEKAQTFLAQLGEEQRNRLKKKQKLSGVRVRVRKQGNLFELIGIAP